MAVSSGDPQAKRVEVGGLVPSTPYSLRVTAVASAGSTTHTYTFTTLTAAGGKSLFPPIYSGEFLPHTHSGETVYPLTLVSLKSLTLFSLPTHSVCSVSPHTHISNHSIYSHSPPTHSGSLSTCSQWLVYPPSYSGTLSTYSY